MLLLAVALTLVPEAGEPAYRQPQLAVSGGTVGVAFGAGNAVYFAGSGDNGRSFAKPVKVAECPHLALGRHRGPRIAIAGGTIVVSAVSGRLGGGKDGDIVAWRSTDGGATWSGGVRVNDVEASAREGLHAMVSGSDGSVYSVWLDLRGKGTKLYGAFSHDKGATWSKNVLAYESPSGSICECCHPSLAADRSGTIHALWRNSLRGSRDMYVARSKNGGRTFGTAQKLGAGSWELKGCPMDGGGIAVAPDGRVRTVWRRVNQIYEAEPGHPESLVGEGKDPAIAVAPSGVFTAWSGARGVVARIPVAPEPVDLGPGGFVQLHTLSNGRVLAAWESSRGISLRILE